jgi:hypothetical protein
MATVALKRYFPPGIRGNWMGKKLSDEEIARYERDGGMICNQPASRRNPRATRLSPGRLKGGSRLSPGRRCLAVGSIFIGLLLVSAGCAERSASSDEERRGGFYGTVSGGMSHP